MSRPLRPDRIYRTGVLAPMVGYEPGTAVQTVAQRFTSAGPYVIGQPTAGMTVGLAAPPLSWLQRMRIRFQAARSEKRARRMLKKLAQLNIMPPAATQPVAGLHGLEPARQSMAMQAAQISMGMMPMPMGARTRLQAGTAIIPQSSGIPQQLSAEAVNRAPPYVAQRAGSYGYGNWAGKRSWWFDKHVPFRT